MAHRLRLFVQGGIYHVYCRTHRGEQRFDREIEDAPPSAQTFDDRFPDLPPSPPLSLEVALQRACCHLGLSRAELCGPSNRPSISLARRRFAFVATCILGHRGKSVAHLLSKSPCQVSRWLRWQTGATARDPDEAVVVENLAARLLERDQASPPDADVGSDS